MTYQLRMRDAEERERLANDMINSLAINSIQQIVDPLSHPAFYLPADRAGVMHAHQVVVRSLIAGATRTALRPNLPMPAISGVLGDFLEQLVAFASVSRQKSDIFDELALHLEQTVLRGTIRVERSEIDYPSISYRPSGWERDLPLMNASSMVSELTPVVLYLRHVVQPGDLLIIEEPEAHLHPEMQAAFTRFLASAFSQASESSSPRTASGFWKSWRIWCGYRSFPRNVAWGLRTQTLRSVLTNWAPGSSNRMKRKAGLL